MLPDLRSIGPRTDLGVRVAPAWSSAAGDGADLGFCPARARSAFTSSRPFCGGESVVRGTFDSCGGGLGVSQRGSSTDLDKRLPASSVDLPSRALVLRPVWRRFPFADEAFRGRTSGPINAPMLQRLSAHRDAHASTARGDCPCDCGGFAIASTSSAGRRFLFCLPSFNSTAVLSAVRELRVPIRAISTVDSGGLRLHPRVRDLLLGALGVNLLGEPDQFQAGGVARVGMLGDSDWRLTSAHTRMRSCRGCSR